MLVIALLGMPIVLGYTRFIHHVYRHKVIVVDDWNRIRFICRIW